MIETLIYLYFAITAAVVSGIVVTAVKLIRYNMTSASVFDTLSPETITKWLDGRKQVIEEWNYLEKASKLVASLVLTIIIGLLLCWYTFTWWLRPILRMKILKDVLTNNFVEVKL